MSAASPQKDPLSILYQDAYLVAIHKPNGLLVHRTPIASREAVFALNLLRDQLGRYVYPIHRLDRKTSGLLLFALDRDTARLVGRQFEARQVKKKYLAIVRGYFPEIEALDYPLRNDKNRLQPALTCFRRLGIAELPIPLGKHATSRYSLIEAYPQTGRMHQIRKHCRHLRHPIIGDRPYGCNKQNRLFKTRWNLLTMMLHASELQFAHPKTGQPMSLKATPPAEFVRIQQILGLDGAKPLADAI